jgi:hypothetical protein
MNAAGSPQSLVDFRSTSTGTRGAASSASNQTFSVDVKGTRPTPIAKDVRDTRGHGLTPEGRTFCNH